MPTEQDPQLAEAIRIARQLSRRRFLTRSGAALGGLMIGPSLLAACGSSGSDSSSDTTGGGGGKELKISNWDAYIDEVNGNVSAKGTTIANFTAATGIKVDYKKDFNDNDEYFNK